MYGDSLPFRFPDTFEGFARSGGVLRAEADGLVLKFQTRDGPFACRAVCCGQTQGSL